MPTDPITKRNLYAADLNEIFGSNISASSDKWVAFDLTPKFHNNNLDKWKVFAEENAQLARILIQAQGIDVITKLHAIPTYKPKLSELQKLIPFEQPNTLAYPARKTAALVTVINKDFLEVAEAFVRQEISVTVVSMSSTKPAEPALKGSPRQEAEIFRRTTLYGHMSAQLRDGVGMQEFDTIFTPRVRVMRKGAPDNYAYFLKPEVDQFKINVISSVPYNLTANTKDQDFKKSDLYKANMITKIRMQLETAIINKQRNLVLTDFGCDAGNDPNVVAQLYKDVLAYPRYVNAFDNITFAISPQADFENTFAQVFNIPVSSKVPQITLTLENSPDITLNFSAFHATDGTASTSGNTPSTSSKPESWFNFSPRTLGILGGASLVLGGFAPGALAYAVATASLFFTMAVKKYYGNKIAKEKKALLTDPVKWKKDHQKPYDIGKKSLHWGPYFKSFAQGTYCNKYPAWKIGLEEAQAASKKKVGLNS